jgi:flagellar assembly factor FliW
MLVATLRFGEIEVDEEKVITFPAGVPGFESFRTFVMLTPDLDLPLSFMQSVEDGNLSFIVANPFLYFPDYDFELPVTVQQELGITGEGEVTIFTTVSINEQDEVSLNLLAPIVVNSRRRLGKQVILHNSTYRTKHFIRRNTTEDNPAENSKAGEGSAC